MGQPGSEPDAGLDDKKIIGVGAESGSEMDYKFNLNRQRKMAEANYNTIVQPARHPNRVMQVHDFLYVIDGKWEIALETENGCRVFQVESGDVMILPAKMHHYGTKPCCANCRNMYVHAAFETGDALVTDRGEGQAKNGYRKSRMDEVPDVCIEDSEETAIYLELLTHCTGNLKIFNLFTEMIAVYWSSSMYKAQKLTHLWTLLLFEIREQQMKSHTDRRYFAFVDEVMQLIQSNPQKFFSVPEISQKFDISERTLNNRFNKVCNKSFYAWQMMYKLERVHQFLRSNPESTLRETALNFGFYDEFHLSRAYKKHFGKSPRHFQQ